MRKTTSILALLLLAGMVLTGCGDNGGSDSGNMATPTDNSGNGNNSGSGNNNSGSGDNNQGTGNNNQGSGDNNQGTGDNGQGSGGNNNQGSGEGSGEGGGNNNQGSGEGGGNNNQGSGEVPGDSQWVNKKFLFHSAHATDETVSAALTQEYQGAYLSMFDSGDFQMVATIESSLMVQLGTFTVAQDDSYAVLNTLSMYDGESESYMYVTSGTQITNIRYNANIGYYVLPMTQRKNNQTISFDCYLTVSTEYPQPVDIPTDPNGGSYDPRYQVYKSSYESIIINRGILYNYSNVTITHTDHTYGYLERHETFEVDNMMFRISYEENQTDALYYERNQQTELGYSFTYSCYSNGVQSGQSFTLEYPLYYWDVDAGIIPIPFNNLRYSPETHAYYASSYTWRDDPNDASTAHTATAIKIYFENYKLTKVTFKDELQSQWEYNYTKYGQTEVDYPTGGGGGQQGGNTSTNIDDYKVLFQNKTLVYSRVSSLDSQYVANANAAYANAKLSIFNDYSAELYFDKIFEYNTNEDIVVVSYGTFNLTSYNENNGNPYVGGSISVTGELYNGTYYDDDPYTIYVRWYINNSELRVQAEDYFIWFTITDTAPQHIEHPEANNGGGSQGGGNQQNTPSYPTNKIATFFEGVTEAYPSFENNQAVDYQYYEPSQYSPYFTLMVEFENSSVVEDVADAFLENLTETLGYKVLYNDDDYETVNVSPNGQIGVQVNHYVDMVVVYLYNFVSNPVTLVANYDLVCDNEWDIFADGAQIYAWVWGGKYDTGEWIELDDYLELYHIDPAATGMKVVRFTYESIISWNGSGVDITDQTGDITLSGECSTIHFSFPNKF